MTVRPIHSPLSVQKIILLVQFHMFEFQGGRSQVQLGRESLDRHLQDGERTSGRAQVPADFSITGAHRAFDPHLARKVSRVGAEKTGELTEVIDRRGNGPAKIRIEPVEGLGLGIPLHR